MSRIKFPEKVILNTQFNIITCIYVVEELLIKTNVLIKQADLGVYSLIILNFTHSFYIVYSMLSFKKINFLMTYTRECALKFNLLLVSEPCYKRFYEYLKTLDDEKGLAVLEFYTELSLFKNFSKLKNIYISQSASTNELVMNLNDDFLLMKKKKKEIINKNKTKNIMTIYEKYLDLQSNKYVELPSNLMHLIHNSYTKNEKKSYTLEWDKVIEYLYNLLENEYYSSFKKSSKFKELLDYLSNDEDIQAKMIFGSAIES